MDDFFAKTKCDRCGGSLAKGRIMSMFNTDIICIKCKEAERQRPDYEQAVAKDVSEYRRRVGHVCCICGKSFLGFGNNPWPIKTEGRCCDACNVEVIKERLRQAAEHWDDK